MDENNNNNNTLGLMMDVIDSREARRDRKDRDGETRSSITKKSGDLLLTSLKVESWHDSKETEGMNESNRMNHTQLTTRISRLASNMIAAAAILVLEIDRQKSPHTFFSRRSTRQPLLQRRKRQTTTKTTTTTPKNSNKSQELSFSTGSHCYLFFTVIINHHQSSSCLQGLQEVV
jgi:hypothetical protein